MLSVVVTAELFEREDNELIRLIGGRSLLRLVAPKR